MTNGELTRWEEILDETLILKSNQKPSEWYEANMIMPAGGPFPGPIRYDRTPYWREPVDCSDPNHPARDITIMGPAQMGKSIMVLNPIVGHTIAMDPCNILFLTGHSDLSQEAMSKIDFMLKQTGTDSLIMPSVIKAKNNRSGDTIKKKEYRGGDLKSGSVTNHNLLRQNTVKKSIADDLDAGKMAKEDTGDTVEKIKTRTKAHENDCKRYWVSTPQVKGQSMIEKQLLRSDRRKWMVECPVSGCRIDLRMPYSVDEKTMAGLTWKTDELGRVDPKTVGYICQECGGFFDDTHKHELLNSGEWVPTQEMLEPYHYGYEINGLYAASGMTSWYTLASKWQLLNAPGSVRNEREWQTFLNDDVGILYEPPSEIPKATDLMKKARSYNIGIVPESVSESDGNGDILLLTATFDCNGTLNDARVDYEIKAWSRMGASYSIKYGSLGTFIPNQSAEQKANTARERWTYEMYKQNSVWNLVDGVLGAVYEVDTGRKMKIFISAIDVGHLTDHCFAYIDRSRFAILGFMGDKENELVRVHENLPVFKQAASRSNLWMINVNAVKDDLANKMKLPWDRNNDQSQPHEFMNFPNYDYKGFFSHYESESRRENEKGYFGWQKKTPTSQNHLWDCAVYQFALRDVFLFQLFKKVGKQVSWTWQDYANICPVRVK